jgi:DnaJ-class molecular chaperone
MNNYDPLEDEVECEHCDGLGYVTVTYYEGDYQEECPVCCGQKWVMDDTL